jgi:putative flippase GtrA
MSPENNGEITKISSPLVRLLAKPQVRWLAAGVAFMGVTTLLLFLLVDLAGLSVLTGTLLTLELCTILRFFVNEWWVFGSRLFSWRRIAQYHVANAGASLIWWIATNALNHFGVHHILAAILAVGVSTGFSFASNFLWIWRQKHPPSVS